MKAFYKDNHNTIYCQDFRTNDLADESVQCVVTSPPYWGLRKYSGEQELIWGGDKDCSHAEMPTGERRGETYRGKKRWQHKGISRQESPEEWVNCEHQWVDDPVPGEKSGPPGPNATVGARFAQDAVRRRKPTNTCSLCGAWKGAYGLEPTPEMYVQHTIEILREIRRVLRKDGVVFLNIGDSYFASGGAHKPEHANPGLSKSAQRGGVPRGKLPNQSPENVPAYDIDGKEFQDWKECDCACSCHNDERQDFQLSRNADNDPRHHTDPLPHEQIDRDIQHQGFSLTSVDAVPHASQESSKPSSSQVSQENPSVRFCSDCLSFHYSASSTSNHLGTLYHIPELKPKDLCLIPFRIAIAAQEDGWWVRSIIIWSKPNPMPESVTDRCTESHEYILMLTKSGKSLYWTHRDGGGTREKPKADYRWVKTASMGRGLKTKGTQELSGQEQHHGQDIDPSRQVVVEEVAIEPTDWKVKIKCPECEGVGKVSVYLGLDVWQEIKCPTCNGKKETQLWKRINLWRGHDYYYDADAVREEYTEPMNRWGGETLKRDTSKTAAYKEMQNIGYSSAFRVGRPMRPDPSGRNLRSVWTFPTTPYPQAHFAVFPEKLPEICIKAAAPEGCCSKCGAPWTRVTKKGFTDHSGETKSTYPEGTTAKRLAKLRQAARGEGKEYQNTSETVGWQPTCKCNADKVPSIVLDPFAGAGTTLWVAKKLNRKAVGYEISEEYCRLAVDRCRQQVLL